MMSDISEAVLAIAETLYTVSETKKALNDQPAHQARVKQVFQAEDEYMRLKLNEDDKSIIETYMEEKDIAAEEKTFLAYVAGGMDMYMFLKERNLLREDVPR